jgi:hypothetical protein
MFIGNNRLLAAFFLSFFLPSTSKCALLVSFLVRERVQQKELQPPTKASQYAGEGTYISSCSEAPNPNPNPKMPRME